MPHHVDPLMDDRVVQVLQDVHDGGLPGADVALDDQDARRRAGQTRVILPRSRRYSGAAHAGANGARCIAVLVWGRRIARGPGIYLCI